MVYILSHYRFESERTIILHFKIVELLLRRVTQPLWEQHLNKGGTHLPLDEVAIVVEESVGRVSADVTAEVK